MRVNQDKSSVIFEFIQPDYSGIMDIEYQYCLKGLKKCTWSEWSEKYSTINFPFLPEGNYTLQVRSRNAFGTVSDVNAIPFKVVPPYWKQPWFYALEFCGFILLLFISVRVKKPWLQVSVRQPFTCFTYTDHYSGVYSNHRRE